MKNGQKHLRENLLGQDLTFLLAFHEKGVEWGEVLALSGCLNSFSLSNTTNGELNKEVG